MAGRTIRVRRAGKLAATQVIPFSRQIASMLGAGMSILSSIMTLEEQCDDPEFKKVLRHLLDVIERGEPLSAGLAENDARSAESSAGSIPIPLSRTVIRR